MAIKIDRQLTAKKLVPRIERMFELSAAKILDLEKSWNPAQGTPVFTVKGKYTTRGCREIKSWPTWQPSTPCRTRAASMPSILTKSQQTPAWPESTGCPSENGAASE